MELFSFFGRIENTKKTFRNSLTFTLLLCFSKLEISFVNISFETIFFEKISFEKNSFKGICFDKIFFEKKFQEIARPEVCEQILDPVCWCASITLQPPTKPSSSPYTTFRPPPKYFRKHYDKYFSKTTKLCKGDSKSNF